MKDNSSSQRIRLRKDLEAEFSDCDYVSDPLSCDRRHLVRCDKETRGLDKGKNDYLCIRTDKMANGINKCIFVFFFKKNSLVS